MQLQKQRQLMVFAELKFEFPAAKSDLPPENLSPNALSKPLNFEIACSTGPPGAA